MQQNKQKAIFMGFSALLLFFLLFGTAVPIMLWVLQTGSIAVCGGVSELVVGFNLLDIQLQVQVTHEIWHQNRSTK